MSGYKLKHLDIHTWTWTMDNWTFKRRCLETSLKPVFTFAGSGAPERSGHCIVIQVGTSPRLDCPRRVVHSKISPYSRRCGKVWSSSRPSHFVRQSPLMFLWGKVVLQTQLFTDTVGTETLDNKRTLIFNCSDDFWIDVWAPRIAVAITIRMRSSLWQVLMGGGVWTAELSRTYGWRLFLKSDPKRMVGSTWIT